VVAHYIELARASKEGTGRKTAKYGESAPRPA